MIQKPQHQGYPNYYDGPPYGPCPQQQGPGGPGPPGYFGGPPNMGQPPMSTKGVHVPNENLTPEQRMHREEQLAKIRRIKQLMENTPHNVPGDPSNFHPIPPHENLDVYNMPV
jgi:hypothetical protein